VVWPELQDTATHLSNNLEAEACECVLECEWMKPVWSGWGGT